MVVRWKCKDEKVFKYTIFESGQWWNQFFLVTNVLNHLQNVHNMFSRNCFIFMFLSFHQKWRENRLHAFRGEEVGTYDNTSTRTFSDHLLGS